MGAGWWGTGSGGGWGWEGGGLWCAQNMPLCMPMPSHTPPPYSHVPLVEGECLPPLALALCCAACLPYACHLTTGRCLVLCVYGN